MNNGDISILPIALEKCSMCHSIVKTNNSCMGMLKMAAIMFDQMYPDSPKGVVNIGAIPCVRNPAH